MRKIGIKFYIDYLWQINFEKKYGNFGVHVSLVTFQFKDSNGINKNNQQT